MSGAGLHRIGSGSGPEAGGSAGSAEVIEVATVDGAAVIEVVNDPDPGVVEVVEPIIIGAEALGVSLDDLVDVVAPADLPADVPLVLSRDAGGVFVVRREQAAEALSYAHTQSVPSSVWLVFHPLPFTPAGLTVTSPDGSRRLWPQRVSYPGPGRARLDFTRPVPGIAHFS